MPKKKSDYTDSLRRIKSQLLVSELQKRKDAASLRAIKLSRVQLDWSSRSKLMIAESAWKYVTDKLGYDPKLVFCHPTLLVDNPLTSLYYRGLCGLSIKAAKDYFGTIENLENGKTRSGLKPEKAQMMSQIYNTFICSIITNSMDWTLEDGARTIIATLGITIDGVMRNKVGEIAEESIRVMLVQWLSAKKPILHPTLEGPIEGHSLPKQFVLTNGVIMEFSSEPDVSFEKEEKLLAIIEIKGGIDPAGALERYGAARKSFEHAIQQSPKCKTFYLGGVFTPELDKRMNMDRFVEHRFSIIDILQNVASREEFLTELFHHTLRVL